MFSLFPQEQLHHKKSAIKGADKNNNNEIQKERERF